VLKYGHGLFDTDTVALEEDEVRDFDDVPFGMGLYDLDQCNADQISLRPVIETDSAALEDEQCGPELTGISRDHP
jgi:hypothetical protein